MSKIMFFTAGTVTTDPEKAAIASIVGVNNEVVVRNKTADLKYADTRETCDFVAGDVPALYNDVDVWDSQATIANGVAITPLAVKVGAAADANYTVTPTIVNGVITKLTLVAL